MSDESNKLETKRRSPFGISLLILIAISCAALAVYVATFSHAPPTAGSYFVLAAVWTATAAIAPIWLESLINNGGTFQLAVVTWRLMTMLGAFVIAGTFPSEVRNYFLSTLMACYFVALPLESWLLARRASK